MTFNARSSRNREDFVCLISNRTNIKYVTIFDHESLSLSYQQLELRELRKQQYEARAAAGESTPPMKETPKMKHKVVDDFLEKEREREAAVERGASRTGGAEDKVDR